MFQGSVNSLYFNCDASMKTYATAIYLHIEKQYTFCVNPKMQLVSKSTSKERLNKDIMLPRLELLAVAIAVRAANFVTSELDYST